MQNVSDYLSALASRAGTTTIVYHGGTEPGAKRRIAPLIVTDTLVYARDLAADEIEAFFLAKIQLADEVNDEREYTRHLKADELTSPLLAVLRPLVAELERLRWDVTLADDIALLHPRRGDGAAHTPTIGIRYHNVPTTKASHTDDMFADDAMILDDSWYVFGPRCVVFTGADRPNSATPYAGLENAVRFFIAQAREYAPIERIHFRQ